MLCGGLVEGVGGLVGGRAGLDDRRSSCALALRAAGAAVRSRSLRGRRRRSAAARTRRAVLSASSASFQVSIEPFTWKPPMTRPTSTGMSRIAFSLVGTRQLRGERRPPARGGCAPSAPSRARGGRRSARRRGEVAPRRARDRSCFASLDQQPLGGRHRRCAAFSESVSTTLYRCTSLTTRQFRHSSTGAVAFQTVGMQTIPSDRKPQIKRS